MNKEEFLKNLSLIIDGEADEETIDKIDGLIKKNSEYKKIHDQYFLLQQNLSETYTDFASITNKKKIFKIKETTNRRIYFSFKKKFFYPVIAFSIPLFLLFALLGGIVGQSINYNNNSAQIDLIKDFEEVLQLVLEHKEDGFLYEANLYDHPMELGVSNTFINEEGFFCRNFHITKQYFNSNNEINFKTIYCRQDQGWINIDISEKQQSLPILEFLLST